MIESQLSMVIHILEWTFGYMVNVVPTSNQFVKWLDN